MDKEKEIKTPIPPKKNPLFVPIDFWLEVIAYCDNRVEYVVNNSGFGKIEVSLKIHKGKIHEVDFREQIGVRDIIAKAGPGGNPSASGSYTEIKPVSDTE